jgi:hypothetical protein
MYDRPTDDQNQHGYRHRAGQTQPGSLGGEQLPDAIKKFLGYRPTPLLVDPLANSR